MSVRKVYKLSVDGHDVCCGSFALVDFAYDAFQFYFDLVANDICNDGSSLVPHVLLISYSKLKEVKFDVQENEKSSS